MIRILGSSAFMALAVLVAVPSVTSARYYAAWALFALGVFLIADQTGGTR